MAHHKARQHEKEVDRQIAVMERIVLVVGRQQFEDMKDDDADGGGAAQAVENFVMGFHWGTGRGNTNNAGNVAGRPRSS